MISGGIDLGGTKIEARLFDAALNTCDMRRIPTPVQDFPSFVAGLTEQLRWLEARSGLGTALPVGIGLPGLIDTRTGRAFAANIPVGGQDLPRALAQAFGREIPLLNDCQAFALSEAHEAGADAGTGTDTPRSVVGLIMGTGLGAGHVIDARLPPRRNGSALEIGHVGIPADLLATFDLPALPCGCGRKGCYETVLAGPGLARLAERGFGHVMTPADLAQAAQAGDARAEAVLDLWARIAGEMLATLQLMADPDCIVIGGGLSNMPGIIARLETALAAARLGAMQLPALRLARHGDSSGARGAALLALTALPRNGQPSDMER